VAKVAATKLLLIFVELSYLVFTLENVYRSLLQHF